VQIPAQPLAAGQVGIGVNQSAHNNPEINRMLKIGRIAAASRLFLFITV